MNENQRTVIETDLNKKKTDAKGKPIDALIFNQVKNQDWVANTGEAYPGFCSINQLEVLLPLPDGMLAYRMVTGFPSNSPPVPIYYPRLR